MSRTLAAILGGAAGVMALAGVAIFVLWCLYHKKSVSRTSETGSSETSIQVGRHAGIELSSQEARRFEMEELALATKGFSEKNLIGSGKFGEVYKGLLNNGMIVAIKKRPGVPSPEFVDEVRYLSPIQHKNLVKLLGYCQENNLQVLVYEYISSGSVSNHLYGVGHSLDGKLEFKHRLSIALEAAKGLAHLHSLTPRLVHKNFKTANVLVDENFIAKVADAGLRNFLGRGDIAGPSTQVTADEIFLAPEVREFRRFSEKSDVFSFGVFLLELLCGKEATEPSPETSQNLVEWVQDTQDYTNFSSIVDQRLGSSFTAEGMEEFIQLMLQCVEPSSERRPAMSYVVMELDRILEKERNLTTFMGEGTPTVTLGSQLFRATE
ncbi:PROTEIN KINASE SUPERFAMILY PROTEIN [Salix purpurea]|uniref:non-specific serine/threonine protein kinase n=1 Tax=Salix purpurea TaxID=77065 RepID=A0A9Q0PEX4_SALPP|nr:PROTEIN KINASE SUPERFAMILY PROTEIN [Salix purpurea]